MRVIDRAFKLSRSLMVLCLAAMVVMVFGNAALRKLSDYGLVLFGGGIDVSEELSRILFVWLTFIGAVVVARENAHLGVDTLVAQFGTRGPHDLAWCSPTPSWCSAARCSSGAPGAGAASTSTTRRRSPACR